MELLKSLGFLEYLNSKSRSTITNFLPWGFGVLGFWGFGGAEEDEGAAICILLDG